MADLQRKILVTSALVYANGPLHLGHMVEQIQMDIWARFQRMRGHICYTIGGCDAHGTPIMLKAQQLKIKPEELIETNRQSHMADLAEFGVHYDNYSSTHTATNKALTEAIYLRLHENNHIATRTIEQAFDPEQEIFLPDRYVKGECPRCHAQDQYGDNCESCGATYDPCDLINPRSVLSNATPIKKASEHLFFDLPAFATSLQSWLQQAPIQAEVTNKLNEWFDSGLQQWDISRDAPYFGFEIPNAPNKYFYVWLDAPIGYIASFKEFCDANALDYNDYWAAHSDTELHHFIGKDIINFHALFWPAMLTGCDLRLPTKIHTHGFLTINGEKMSKSRGTFINARTYLEHLSPEYLRYYLAAKLSAKVEDLDLNFDDFRQRINADLVGKVVNIASRCASFINKRFTGKLGANDADTDLLANMQAQAEVIAECYEQADYARAVRTIMALADQANQYIDEKKPWVMAKDPEQFAHVQTVCTTGLNSFRLLALYLNPILPKLGEDAAAFLNIDELQWQDAQTLLEQHEINAFKPLLQRIEPDAIAALTTSATPAEKVVNENAG